MENQKFYWSYTVVLKIVWLNIEIRRSFWNYFILLGGKSMPLLVPWQHYIFYLFKLFWMEGRQILNNTNWVINMLSYTKE